MGPTECWLAESFRVGEPPVGSSRRPTLCMMAVQPKDSARQSVVIQNFRTLDQFAVFPILSLYRFAMVHWIVLDSIAFCLTRGPGDMSALPPFSPGYEKLQPVLWPSRHQETLLDTHASASFAFGLEKDILDSLFTVFYNCCRIHIIRTCYALLSIAGVEFVQPSEVFQPLRFGPGTLDVHHARGTDHCWTLVSQLRELCPFYHFVNCVIEYHLWTVVLWAWELILFWYFVFVCLLGHVSILIQILILI